MEGTRRIDYVTGTVQLEGEIADDPAILEAVIKDDRVAEVVCVAKVAEVTLAHEGIEGERRHPRAIAFPVNADGGINRLDVIHGPHVSVRVGWMSRSPGSEIQPVKVGDRRWRCGRAQRRQWRRWP